MSFEIFKFEFYIIDDCSCVCLSFVFIRYHKLLARDYWLLKYLHHSSLLWTHMKETILRHFLSQHHIYVLGEVCELNYFFHYNWSITSLTFGFPISSSSWDRRLCRVWSWQWGRRLASWVPQSRKGTWSREVTICYTIVFYFHTSPWQICFNCDSENGNFWSSCSLFFTFNTMIETHRVSVLHVEQLVELLLPLKEKGETNRDDSYIAWNILILSPWQCTELLTGTPQFFIWFWRSQFSMYLLLLSPTHSIFLPGSRRKIYSFLPASCFRRPSSPFVFLFFFLSCFVLTIVFLGFHFQDFSPLVSRNLLNMNFIER